MEQTPVRPSVCPSEREFLENRYISYSGKLKYIHACTKKHNVKIEETWVRSLCLFTWCTIYNLVG
jgi:hypothetical protein